MAHSPNLTAVRICREAAAETASRVAVTRIADAEVFDFGVQARGSIRAGLALGRACMGGLGEISLVPLDPTQYAVANGVFVRTDSPLMACLGCQYAGWPVQSDDFFAMGSGPMRLFRGKEPLLEKLGLSEGESQQVCGILESDKLPTESAIEKIASDCGVAREAISVAIAASTSLAGSIQIVARSVETAMHKLDELGFDVRNVLSATGVAPLAPPAKPGDFVGGIGRTNDAMLYGATTSLWVDAEDDELASIVSRVPSTSSPDHGRPFAKIFADYDHDFYKVDPGLFSPASVLIHNLRSGRTHRHGQIETQILRESFGT